MLAAAAAKKCAAFGAKRTEPLTLALPLWPFRFRQTMAYVRFNVTIRDNGITATGPLLDDIFAAIWVLCRFLAAARFI